MSKIIKFKCDTCGHESSDGDKFVGLLHLHREIALRSPGSVERHVCKECANLLRKALAAGDVE